MDRRESPDTYPARPKDIPADTADANRKGDPWENPRVAPPRLWLPSGSVPWAPWALMATQIPIPLHMS